MNTETKKIVVLSTGGTIASAPGEDGRNVSGALPGEVLTQKLNLPDAYQLEVHSLFQKPSNAITGQDLLVLHRECQALMQRGDVNGIVITHGTDTLEDTAYFLASTLDTAGCTLVLTGSQRVPHAEGTDAFVNLRQSIIVAGAPAARGMGALLVFNESIYSAYTVRKLSSFQLNGFGSPSHGRLGYVDNDKVWIHQRPVLQPVLAIGPELPRVDIHSAYLDAPGDLIDASVVQGAKGLVIAGVGRGHVPPDWMPHIRKALAANVVVVICSACLHGPVHQSYEFPGSLHDLEEAGAITAGDLGARKARLRLMAYLSLPTHAPSDANQAFARLIP